MPVRAAGVGETQKARSARGREGSSAGEMDTPRDCRRARRLWRITAHVTGGVAIVRPPPDNVSNVPWVPDAAPLTETGFLTPAEYAAGAIEPAKLQFLAEFFQREGYAIVGGLFPPELLERIEPRLDEDAGHQVAVKILQDREDGGSAAQSMRHLGNGLPRQAPWVFPVRCNGLPSLCVLCSTV